jgi:prepilin-type N-terminal cleavage/methylation domain-containing protein
MAMLTRTGTQTTRKHLLNQQGFTLVEICVAMGIGAILILSLAQYSLTAARSQKSQDLSNEFGQVMGTVGQALANQSACTSIVNNISPSALASPLVVPITSLNIAPTGSNPQIILAAGVLPSGLNIQSIYIAGTPTPMGPASGGGYTPENISIIVTAMKGPTPSATPSGGPGLNTYFIGNNFFTKTFTVSAWVTASNSITKCISSQDMAQQAPIGAPAVYPSPISSGCVGNAPTCPGSGESSLATCCTPSSAPVPYWACQTSGWTCS